MARVSKVGYPAYVGRIYKRPGLALTLRCLCYLAVISTVGGYGYMLVEAFTDSWVHGARLLAVSALPFLLISLFRRVMDAPRPYEVYDLSELGIDRPKRKEGRSFPSRHVFSAFLIGTLLFAYLPPLGGAVLSLGALLAVLRVLLAIHFVRDVVVGAIFGTVSGVIGLLVIIL